MLKSSLVHLEFREASCNSMSLSELLTTPYRLPFYLILTCLIHTRSVCKSLTHTLRTLSFKTFTLPAAKKPFAARRCRERRNIRSLLSQRLPGHVKYDVQKVLSDHPPSTFLNQSVCLLLPPLVSPAGNPNRSSPKLFVLSRLGASASTLLFKTICNTMLLFDPPTLLLIRFFFVNTAVLLKGIFRFNAIFSTLSFLLTTILSKKHSSF